MKNNMLKMLVALGVVAGLAACDQLPKPTSEESSAPAESSEPAGPATVTFGELLELDSEAPYGFVLEGEEVKMTHLGAGGLYGRTVIGNGSVGDYVSDLRGIEIELAEGQELPARGDEFNVVGTVANVDGRAVLKNAEIDNFNPRQYDDDGKRIDGTGTGIYYWPSSAANRARWDYYMTRTMSGIMFDSLFQLASVPESISAEAESSFQVVFPGEDYTIPAADSTETNEALIKVTIPAGLTEKAIGRLNAFFNPTTGAAPTAGSYISLTSYTRWESYQMNLVFESFYSEFGTVSSSDIPTTYKTWAAVEEDFGGTDGGLTTFFNIGIPAFGTALEEAGAFTYTVEDKYMETPLDELYSSVPTYISGMFDEEVLPNVELMEFHVNPRTGKKAAVADAMIEALLPEEPGTSTLEWQQLAKRTDAFGADLLVLVNTTPAQDSSEEDQEEVLAEIIIDISGTSVDVDYFAEKVSVESTAAQVLAAIDYYGAATVMGDLGYAFWSPASVFYYDSYGTYGYFETEDIDTMEDGVHFYQLSLRTGKFAIDHEAEEDVDSLDEFEDNPFNLVDDILDEDSLWAQEEVDTGKKDDEGNAIMAPVDHWFLDGSYPKDATAAQKAAIDAAFEDSAALALNVSGYGAYVDLLELEVTSVDFSCYRTGMIKFELGVYVGAADADAEIEFLLTVGAFSGLKNPLDSLFAQLPARTDAGQYDGYMVTMGEDAEGNPEAQVDAITIVMNNGAGYILGLADGAEAIDLADSSTYEVIGMFSYVVLEDLSVIIFNVSIVGATYLGSNLNLNQLGELTGSLLLQTGTDNEGNPILLEVTVLTVKNLGF